MAIAYARSHYITRSKGHSAIAAAAYRSGTRLHDERTGRTENYSNRHEHVVYSEVYLPDGADEKFKDREYLWNSVEAAEDQYNTRRRQAQVARDIVIALPRDPNITHEDHVELARRFAYEHFVKYGLVVDISIHYDSPKNEDEAGKGDSAAPDGTFGNNPHAHLMVTTRRLIGDEWDRYKARDLSPGVRKGMVVDAEDFRYGQFWREIQNSYFEENEIDLEVDPNGLVSQIHLGKTVTHHPDKSTTAFWTENHSRESQAKRIALTDPEAILNQITLYKSTFTEADLAKLIDRHFTKLGIIDPIAFQATLAKVKASRSLLFLGPGPDGREYYTTRLMFETETDSQTFVDYLKQLNHHSVAQRHIRRELPLHTGLNESECDIATYLVSNKNINILIGSPFTDKRRLEVLAASRNIWARNSYRVLGVSLKADNAKALGNRLNVEARSVYSFNNGLRKGWLKLNKNDVIILDQAHLINDSVALCEMLGAVAKANAKMVITGHRGVSAQFEALLERVGFAELQADDDGGTRWQHQAQRFCRNNDVSSAIDLFNENKHIHFAEAKKTQQALVSDFIDAVKQRQLLKTSMIMAGTNADVEVLNSLARAELVKHNIIHLGARVAYPDIQKTEQNQFLTAGKCNHLAIGERITLKRTEQKLGVVSGDLATIDKLIREKNGKVLGIEITLDRASDKPIQILFEHYQQIDYAYSLNRNQLSGRVFEKTFGYYSGYIWNRYHLAMALNSARQSHHLYVDQSTISDLDALKRLAKREPNKDSVYDWPYHYRERRNMPLSDGILERFKAHLKNTAADFKDAVEKHITPTQYEKRKVQQAQRERQATELEKQYSDAKWVAQYVDAKNEAGRFWSELHAYQARFIDRYAHAIEFEKIPRYNRAFDAIRKRDALASKIMQSPERYTQAIQLHQLETEKLQTQTDAHIGFDRVAQYKKEVDAGRAIFRNRLASQILQEPKAHAMAMTHFKLDWRDCRRHAISYDRLIKLKELSPQEASAFKTVEHYIDAYWDAQKYWQRYFKLKNTTTPGDEKKSEQLSWLAEKASNASLTRNQNAGLIYQDKPQFRAGLEFHKIKKDKNTTHVYLAYKHKNKNTEADKEKAKALVFAKREIKLNKYANQYLAKERLKQFISETDELKKGNLAETILRYPQFHKRGIAEIVRETGVEFNAFYGELHRFSNQSKKERLINTLNDSQKIRLADIEYYIQLNDDVRNAWQAVSNQRNNPSLIRNAALKTKERDEAALAIKNQFDQYALFFVHFNLDRSLLDKALSNEAARERIKLFINPNISVKEKATAAQFIVNERKAHNLAMSELQVDWRDLYPYADKLSIQTTRYNLREHERQDFDTLWRYARLRKRIARLFVNKKQHNTYWKREQQTKFNRLITKRDALANQLLMDWNRYAEFAETLRISERKLQPHAARYIKCRIELTEFYDQRLKQLKALASIIQNKGELEELALKRDPAYLKWRSNWETLLPKTQYWSKQGERYSDLFNELDLTNTELEKDLSLLTRLDEAVQLLHKNYQPEKSTVIKTITPKTKTPTHKHWDRDRIITALNDNARDVVLAAVDPNEMLNERLSNGNKLVFGKKAGSLHVTISGDRIGWWNDFSSNQGGRNLLAFIQEQQSLSFQEALEWSARFLELSEYDKISTPIINTAPALKAFTSEQPFTENEIKRIERARRIWNESTAITNTIAENFLREHRDIQTDLYYDLRFHNRVWNFDTEKAYPALIIGARNSQGEIQSIQAVFIDSATNNQIDKTKTALRKYTAAPIKHSSAWLNKYDPNKPVAITEAAITGLSVKEAKGSEWNVIASLGSSNFRNVHLPKETNTVIIAYDHDANNNVLKSAERAGDYFAKQGIDVYFVKPDRVGFDFNDVHQQQGLSELKRQLDNMTLYKKGIKPKSELEHIKNYTKFESEKNLTEQSAWQNEIKQLVHANEWESAFDLMQKRGVLIGEKDRAHTISRLLNAWFKANDFTEHQAASLIGFTEQDVNTLTDGARFLLKRAGKITDTTYLNTEEGFKEFGAGDHITLTKNWSKKHIKSGDTAIITNIDRGQLSVKLSDNKTLTFTLSDYKSFTYSYAILADRFAYHSNQNTLVLMNKSCDQPLLQTTVRNSNSLSLFYSEDEFSSALELKQRITINKKSEKVLAKKQRRKRKTYDTD